MDTQLFYELAVYLVLSALITLIQVEKIKISLLALLNLGAVYYFFFASTVGIWAFVGYLLFVFVTFVLLSISPRKSHTFYFVCFWLPVAWLVATKAFSWVVFIGVSYMAFRLSYLVYELHTKGIEKPNIAQYFGFAFFLPTFLMGPISPYEYYERSLSNPDRKITPVATSAKRIIIGLAKLFFVAIVFQKAGVSALLFDGYDHGLLDLVYASVSSFLFLYFNFSGYTDIVVGGAGLLNIRVKENFRNPLLAPNLREFWNRWHISLTDYMREIVFNPLSMSAVRTVGVNWLNHALAAVILFTFLLIGVWHGVGWSFVLLGLYHGMGLVVNHYWNVGVKKMPKQVQAALSSQFFVVFGTGLTFLYVCMSSIFFECDLDQLKDLYEKIHWSI